MQQSIGWTATLLNDHRWRCTACSRVPKLPCLRSLFFHIINFGRKSQTSTFRDVTPTEIIPSQQFLFGSLRPVEESRDELECSGSHGGKEGGSGWKWVTGQKKKKNRISFHNHTYLRPTLPFRFPPFPERHCTHTHTHHALPLTHSPKTAPDVKSRGAAAAAVQEFEQF